MINNENLTKRDRIFQKHAGLVPSEVGELLSGILESVVTKTCKYKQWVKKGIQEKKKSYMKHLKQTL